MRQGARGLSVAFGIPGRRLGVCAGLFREGCPWNSHGDSQLQRGGVLKTLFTIFRTRY